LTSTLSAFMPNCTRSSIGLGLGKGCTATMGKPSSGKGVAVGAGPAMTTLPLATDRLPSGLRTSMRTVPSAWAGAVADRALGPR
jgi:hypothetical protein